MPLARQGRPRFRAVIFDLDETLLLRARAWQYAVEQAVASVTGQRVDAGPLAGEYRHRPWEHALGVLLADSRDAARCAALCGEMFYRSGMKRLLVHEGLGMALDQLRAGRVEIGAISREQHRIARHQIESAGLERFVGALSGTPEGAVWAPAARAAGCLAFFEYRAADCVFVSGEASDLRAAAEAGFVCLEAGWATSEPSGFPQISRPADLPALAAP
jgi:phosphoglycolate phosphatase-like HAD superfamily hydrolase